MALRGSEPEQAGETRLRGDAQSELRIEAGARGPHREGQVTKPQASEAIIVEAHRGSDDARIMVIGPASFESVGPERVDPGAQDSLDVRLKP